MNRSAITGILIAAAVLWFGVIHPASKPMMFLDMHAIILVLGGTMAAALIAFPGKQFFSLLEMFFLAVIFPKRKDPLAIAQQIVKVKSGNILEQGAHGFLRESVQLLNETTLDPRELERVLRRRAAQYKKRYQMDYKVLNALAKFPPAFGLLGASTGMIEMMSKLGKGGSESIGAAMAIALVATFWGIAMANLVILPLADNANKMASDDANIRGLIIDGIVSIRRGESEEMLVEMMRSYLNPDDRKALGKMAKLTPLRSLSKPTDETQVG